MPRQLVASAGGSRQQCSQAGAAFCDCCRQECSKVRVQRRQCVRGDCSAVRSGLPGVWVLVSC
jgi:hypothetical protein